MLRHVFAILALLLPVPLALAGVTSLPDPKAGKALAEKLCTNCHLVGSATQQQPANADVPSFPEIANLEGQTAGAIAARIMLPKHPMPQIPLTKAEISDLAAYILSLRNEAKP
ncbi:c-type cytochrome [Methyloceanibacter sp.]|uniref:c-type cytochrome n=1 Tax=Methyloceanibacter sp. TaxID=1965321 RepID=UPI003D6C8988